MTTEECVDFDNELLSFYPPINSEMVALRTKSVQQCCNEYINKECVELDSEDDEETHENNKGNDGQNPFQLKPRDALTMMDGLLHTSGIIEDNQNSLVSMKEELEKIVISQAKQRSICDYFA